MIAIKRLYQAFLYWQYTCRLNGAAMQVERRHLSPDRWLYPEMREIPGPLLHASQFLSYLGRLRPGDRFEQDRFLGTADTMSLTGGGYSLLPLFLAFWAVGSRRVYRASLSGIVSAGAVDIGDTEIPWTEMLPHSVFTVELDQPLCQGHLSFDTILVMQIESGEVVCTLCDPNLEHINLLSERDIEAVEKAAKGDPQRFAQLFRGTLDRLHQGGINGLFVPLGRTGPQDPILIQLEAKVAAILQTLCVHLAYGGTTVRQEPSARSVQSFRGGPQRVFIPEGIFGVPTEYILQKRSDIRAEAAHPSGRIMPPHSRRAHMRRPAGSPPDHPKTILVGSTIINRHLLVEGQDQLRGSRVTVFTDPARK